MRFFIQIILLCLLVSSFCFAEDSEETLESRLFSVLELKSSLQDERVERQTELKSPEGRGREEELKNEIVSISRKLEELDTNFSEMALGVDLSSLEAPLEENAFSWSDELRDLLGPLIEKVRDLTSRPREISNLKAEIETLKSKDQKIIGALAKVSELQEEIENERVSKELDSIAAGWKAKETSVNTALSIAQQKLDGMLAEKKSFGETVTSVLSVFFESRGRNLFISILAALAVWFGCRIIPKVAFKRSRSKSAKVFQVVAFALSSVLATLTFLGCLYIFEDWLLLLLSSLVLLGVFWTMKDTLPRLWQQFATILNLGAVREGERVVYLGVPWVVRSLGFYSYFTNKAFTTAKNVRLPIKDVLELRSRPHHDNEKLFPTNTGDFTVLSDETYGEVLFQSPDYVELKLFDGSVRRMQTADFLAGNPRNLSEGFGVMVPFGIDYDHQSLDHKEVSATFKKAVQEHMTDFQITKCSVEFSSASASSLDYAVVATFKGSAANRYLSIPRNIQAACVEVCNQQNWTIPFTQLTIHSA